MAVSKKNIKYITGEANYCYTTRTNESGRYPSHCYEVGLLNPSCEDEKFYNKLSKEEIIKHNDNNDTTLKIANSKYPIPMYDKNGKEMDIVKLQNGVKIMIAVSIKHNDNYDKDYLICHGIKLMEDYKPFNPFD